MTSKPREFKYNVNIGDAVKWCNEYDGPLFHALLDDPPYNLDSIQKRFGKKSSKPAKRGTNGVFQRASKGFMGSTWDSDVAFNSETWEAFKKVLLPGAFGIAFSSTRTYHRMTTAIEDAGFIIHPMIIWAFRNGFPKGTRLDDQIDKAAGLKIDKGKAFNYKGNVIYGKYAERTNVDYKAQTALAQAWEGHRYGLQALKPSLEPACVFQVPFPSNSKPFESIARTGSGTLNIYGAWIDGAEGYTRNNKVGQNGNFNASGGTIESEGGKWPANLIIDDSYIIHAIEKGVMFADDAELFYLTDLMLDRLEESDPVIFCAKASVPEREAGLNAMQRRLVVGEDDFEELEGTVNDGREAVSDRPYLRNQSIRRNIHATIKPLALCKYLATLLLPPLGVTVDGICDNRYSPRRLFVPFSGVGSEMIGGLLAGWEHVEGCELLEDHGKIANARIKYWTDLKNVLGDDVISRARISTKLKRTTDKVAEHEQSEMF